MSKKILFIFSIILAIIFFSLIFYFIFVFNNSEKNHSYEVEKTSTNNNIENSASNNSNNDQKSDITNDNTTLKNNEESSSILEEDSKAKEINEKMDIPEEKISAFSTKIYSKDSSRQNNINITCNALNGSIVKNGSTFSFCSTIGPSTSNKGYKEADIFDANGNKKKGLGGGNCQISTTLYNAVLEAPGLKVTERHKHSNYVPYIAKGKDAAVAYGSYDLKFLNSSGYDVKILASSSSDLVSISLVKIRIKNKF